MGCKMNDPVVLRLPTNAYTIEAIGLSGVSFARTVVSPKRLQSTRLVVVPCVPFSWERVVIVTCFRKWVAAFALLGALGFVAVVPTVLFALDASAANPHEKEPYPPFTSRITAYPENKPSAQDNTYVWLISIATPIAVIASAWGAVRSVQNSHAETLKEIKTANDATNEKVDVVAAKVEKLGREVAYIQGQFDRQSDDD